MTTQLNNGSITFGDGSIQTTKTPTVTSAFSNDSGYQTISGADAIYSQRATPVRYVNGSSAAPNGGSRPGGFNYYDINGTYLGTTGYWNCNCNC